MVSEGLIYYFPYLLHSSISVSTQLWFLSVLGPICFGQLTIINSTFPKGKLRSTQFLLDSPSESIYPVKYYLCGQWLGCSNFYHFILQLFYDRKTKNAGYTQILSYFYMFTSMIMCPYITTCL